MEPDSSTKISTKATWLSPDQNTKNQIDHVVIDGRHASSVMDVRVIRGANIGSDHYLVAAKVRTRLSRAKNARNLTQRKLDIAKLQTPEIATAYSNQLSQLLRQHASTSDVPDIQWQHIAHSMATAATTVLGYEKRRSDESWYDEECRIASEEQDAAYRATLQPIVTRAVRERHKETVKRARQLFKRKKRQMKERENEDIERYRDRGEARIFYQKVISKGYANGLPSCKDKDGTLVTDTQSVLHIWREHFQQLLVPEGSAREGITPIVDDGLECPPPSQTEVRSAISRLKNNKAAGADGLPAELFKFGGEELITSMHQLLRTVWLNECMPDDWNLSVLCPVLKKGDPSVCSNYRGISLLPISYKVLSSVLCERLKPVLSNLIGPYQCGC